MSLFNRCEFIEAKSTIQSIYKKQERKICGMCKFEKHIKDFCKNIQGVKFVIAKEV